MKRVLITTTLVALIAILAVIGYKTFNLSPQDVARLTSTSTTGEDAKTPLHIYACTENGATAQQYKWPQSIDPAHILNTSCLGPDGNAYDPGTQLTFYKAAIMTGDEVEPTCSSVTKTCINGSFQGDDPNNTYTRLDCRIINLTTGDTTTCTYEGEHYLPGETIITYAQPYSSLDEDCIQSLAYCNGNGERYSAFSDHAASSCTFTRSYSSQYLTTRKDILTYADSDTLRPEVVACISTTWAQCQTPRGTRVDHGESFLSFNKQQVNFDQRCHVRTTTCLDGGWYNDLEPYPHPTCQKSTPDSCRFNGTLIPHDTSLTYYKRNTDAQGNIIDCEEETKYCFDGELEGDPDFTYRVCDPSQQKPPEATTDEDQAPSPDNQQDDQDLPPTSDTEDPASPPNDTSQDNTTTTNNQEQSDSSQETDTTFRTNAQAEPNCPNPFGGAPWQPRQEGTAYEQATVPFGSNCEAIPIVCAYGSIRQGTAEAPGEPVSNLSQSCTVTAPVNCTHPCGNREHGQALLTYETDLLEHGAGETCDDYEIRSTCENGTYTPQPADYCSCSIAQPVGCVTAGGIRASHGESLTLYKDEEIQAEAEDGSDVCLRQYRTCLNGQRYDNNGDVNPFTYQYQTCEIVPPNQ